MESTDTTAICVESASASDLEAIRRLLESAGLPCGDLTPPHLDSFVCAKSGEDLVGVIGFEAFGQDALVRSLAVVPSHRGRGIGSNLLADVENVARQHGVKTLYGLTETIEPLLLRRGYGRIDRADAPESIRATSEFRALCPASAVLLVKRIARELTGRRSRVQPIHP